MKPNKNYVLITGGGSGIGKALAHKFSLEDNHLLLVGRNESALKQVIDSLPHAQYRVCDLTDSAQMDELIYYVETQFQKCNLLINCAGVQHQYPDPEDFGEVKSIAMEFQTNLVVPAQLTSLLLPLLITKKDAAIVIVSSALAVSPKEVAPYYCASKSGLHSLCQTLSWRLSGTNVNLIELVPPLTKTAMIAGRDQKSMTVDKLADLFWQGFLTNQRVIAPAEAGKLLTLSRWFPGLANRLTRNS
ncbi:MAG: SDR family NAD(P)-dependent oxidoreductase [Proteobacteria bacterium]|nr:SDR family NAD(P)-dependent oxidoreductase [Pseudomonadota bacterium]